MNFLKKYYKIITITLLLALAEVIICLFRSHFIVLEQESLLFVYTFDFFEKFASFPALGEWSWQSNAEPGGISRYCELFLIQFYSLKCGPEIINLFLLFFIVLCWYRISLRIGARKVVSIIFTISGALLYIWLMISPAFLSGTLIGYIINSAAILLFCKINNKTTQWLLYPIITALLFYMTGMPTVLLFLFVGIIIVIKSKNYLGLPSVILFFFFPSLASKAYSISIYEALNKRALKEWRHGHINKERIVLEKIKNILYTNTHTSETYNKVLCVLDDFWAEWKDGINSDILIELANYTKNALIFSNGELNNKFFSYGKFIGIGEVLPVSPFGLMESMYDFQLETGLVSAAQNQEMERIKARGVSPISLKHILKASLLQQNKKLSNKYYYLSQNSLFYKNTDTNISNITPITFTVAATELFNPKNISAIIRKAYKEKPTMTLLNLAVMLDLLDKNIDSAIAKISMYKELGYNQKYLPRYLQEALLIKGINPSHPYLGYDFSREVINRFLSFAQAFDKYQIGESNYQKIIILFENTYSCYYFFYF